MPATNRAAYSAAPIICECGHNLSEGVYVTNKPGLPNVIWFGLDQLPGTRFRYTTCIINSANRPPDTEKWIDSPNGFSLGDTFICPQCGTLMPPEGAR